VQDRLQLAQGCLGHGLLRRPYFRRALNLAAPGHGPPRLRRGPVGDAVQPAAHRVTLADRGRLASEDEERRLEGVFRVLLVAQHRTADAQHQRAVPPHQGGERLLVVPAQVTP
jgi:hypothetical protein